MFSTKVAGYRNLPDMVDSDSSALSPVKPGDVLAEKYEVEQVLGVGGMGVVVAAKHIQLGGSVALKFLRPSAVESPEVVSRFSREAQAARKIKSEHVARVIDVGKLETGSPYMVMEYLEGCDLCQVLTSSGPLPIWDAVDYLMQAMDAIAEAHSLGIVHRDLKPSNLFLTKRPDDSPLIKVLDFGISKAADPLQSAQLTQTSGVLGSPLYMSPEQIRSTKHVDARADIWSLGVILYELLAGTGPFSGGETAGAVFAAILADPPPSLRAVRPDVPIELEAAINRCLAKTPAERFSSVAALATALAPFGGRDSQTYAARIQRLLAKTDGKLAPAASAAIAVTTPFVSNAPLPPPPAVEGSQPNLAGSGTRVGWGSTTGQPGTTASQNRSKAPLFLAVGGGVALLAVIGLAVGGIMISRHRSAAGQPEVAVENVPTAPKPDPTPTPSATTPPPPETVASPVPSAEPAPSAGKTSTKTTTTTTRSTKTTGAATPKTTPKEDTSFEHR
jgi:serine/threonine-protein kinase